MLEAADGQDAIRVAAEHPGPIHLLLTDVMMPGMNGCELAAGLVRAAARPEGDVHVRLRPRLPRARSGLNPIGPVITKPFTTEYLSRRVRMVLDRQPEAATAR